MHWRVQSAVWYFFASNRKVPLTVFKELASNFNDDKLVALRSWPELTLRSNGGLAACQYSYRTHHAEHTLRKFGESDERV